MLLISDAWDAVLGAGMATLVSAILGGLVLLYRTRHREGRRDATHVQETEERVADQWKKTVKDQDRRYDDLLKLMNSMREGLEAKITNLDKSLDEEKELHRKTLRKYDQLLVAVRNQAKAIRSYERAMKEAKIPFRPFEAEEEPIEEAKS